MDKMQTRFSFINDLSGVELSDSWIQAFPLGKWTHPEYGDIEMDLNKAVSMAANVNAGVRGQDLDIDFDHKAIRKDAAGWVQQAEARPDGLWLNIDWTDEAAEMIKDKKYRYFSPEFVDEWEHPANGQKFKHVLFGGALTNRPHLKGILPVNLSEYPDVDEKSTERKLLEDIAKLYNIEFDDKTLDDTIKSAIAKVIDNMRKQKRKKKKRKTSYSEPKPAPKNENPVGAITMALNEEDWSHF